MKLCFKCFKTLPLEMFHKHKEMRDGRLNKCKICVKISVDLWRIKNPSCRRAEHARNREKLGCKTRKEYLESVKNSAIGRKVSLNKYATKRRLKTIIKDELTEFVFEEAILLRQLREHHTNIKWHVDHIVPLNGKLVSGLHVYNNFRVIPKTENLKKGNKFDQSFLTVSGY